MGLVHFNYGEHHMTAFRPINTAAHC